MLLPSWIATTGAILSLALIRFPTFIKIRVIFYFQTLKHSNNDTCTGLYKF